MDLVARKLLRVNLSDLAAKGANPTPISCRSPGLSGCGWAERQAFAREGNLG
jgi:thiamine-monophosphate kinase